MKVYKKNRPTTPRAPTRPEPTTADGNAAALVDCDAGGVLVPLPAPVEVAESVGDLTVLVVLPLPVGFPLIVPAGWVGTTWATVVSAAVV